MPCVPLLAATLQSVILVTPKQLIRFLLHLYLPSSKVAHFQSIFFPLLIPGSTTLIFWPGWLVKTRLKISILYDFKMSSPSAYIDWGKFMVKNINIILSNHHLLALFVC